MNQNQNKKTLRHFQCRDFLWEIFEQMSGELECSVDYLINEAMRQYARARNYSPRQGVGGPGEAMPAASRTTRPVGPPPPGAMPPGPGPRPPTAARPGPPPPLPGNRPQPPRPMPPGGGMGGPPPGGVTVPRPSPGGPPAGPGAFGGGPAPHPAPHPGGHGAVALPPGAPQLFLIFNGRKLPVNKEQFIIGRGTKTSDLPIKDGNISRKHAAVILHSGVYYLKDLGSTNGIEYNGMRIDNKRIEEGDVFHICDYELRFTYR